jgi:tRNA C32,U32 (ribose-2'-O)-methylase TrmJ
MGDLTPFRFLLVEPRYAGNVGATARGIKNFGFTRLELVAPLCSPGDEEARRFAVDAGDVLASAVIHPGLDDALRGATCVVGLSRRMGKQRQPHYRIDEIAPRIAGIARHGGRKVVGALPEGSPNDRVAAEQSCDDIAERAEHAHGVHYAADRNIRPINELLRQHLGRSHKLAATVEIVLLFGREADGLHDLELDLCTHLAYIPTADVYPAMNLGQSVAITAYELSRALDALGPAPAPRPLGAGEDEGDDALADHSAREAMYAHLEESLTAVGFLKDGQVEGMMRRLRRILGRAELTEGDLSVVRGIARQVLWLSRNR